MHGRLHSNFRAPCCNATELGRQFVQGIAVARGARVQKRERRLRFLEQRPSGRCSVDEWPLVDSRRAQAKAAINNGLAHANA